MRLFRAFYRDGFKDVLRSSSLAAAPGSSDSVPNASLLHTPLLESYRSGGGPPSPQTQRGADIDKLSEEFSALLGEGNHLLSMAQLQGFLMQYKNDPYMAVGNFSAWRDSVLIKTEH